MITSLSDMLKTTQDELVEWLEENQYKYNLVPVDCVDLEETQIEPQKTPCEEYGYKVGDKFIAKEEYPFTEGSIIELLEDDGSEFPMFKLCDGTMLFGVDEDIKLAFVYLGNVTKRED